MIKKILFVPKRGETVWFFDNYRGMVLYKSVIVNVHQGFINGKLDQTEYECKIEKGQLQTVTLPYLFETQEQAIKSIKIKKIVK